MAQDMADWSSKHASDNEKRHVIPGPTGIVRAALRRRAKVKGQAVDEDIPPLSIQEDIEIELKKDDGNEPFLSDLNDESWKMLKSTLISKNLSYFSIDVEMIESIMSQGRDAKKIYKMIVMIYKFVSNGFEDFF